MASAQLINCIICRTPVRPRQQAIQCDGCYRWNHRMCNTGISQEEYRAAVREGNGIDWCCPVQVWKTGPSWKQKAHDLTMVSSTLIA